MTDESDYPPRKKRRTQLSSLPDVQRELAAVCRKLKTKSGLLEAEISRARALVYALSKLADLMSVAGLSQVSDAALAAEIIRRRDSRLGPAALGTEAQQ